MIKLKRQSKSTQRYLSNFSFRVAYTTRFRFTRARDFWIFDSLALVPEPFTITARYPPAPQLCSLLNIIYTTAAWNASVFSFVSTRNGFGAGDTHELFSAYSLIPAFSFVFVAANTWPSTEAQPPLHASTLHTHLLLLRFLLIFV